LKSTKNTGKKQGLAKLMTLAFDLRWPSNTPRVGTQSCVVGLTLHVQMLENVWNQEGHLHSSLSSSGCQHCLFMGAHPLDCSRAHSLAMWLSENFVIIRYYYFSFFKKKIYYHFNCPRGKPLPTLNIHILRIKTYW